MAVYYQNVKFVVSVQESRSHQSFHDEAVFYIVIDVM
jgi:hypothetical protein